MDGHSGKRSLVYKKGTHFPFLFQESSPTPQTGRLSCSSPSPALSGLFLWPTNISGSNLHSLQIAGDGLTLGMALTRPRSFLMTFSTSPQLWSCYIQACCLKCSSCSQHLCNLLWHTQHMPCISHLWIHEKHPRVTLSSSCASCLQPTLGKRISD